MRADRLAADERDGGGQRDRTRDPRAQEDAARVRVDVAALFEQHPVFVGDDLLAEPRIEQPHSEPARAIEQRREARTARVRRRLGHARARRAGRPAPAATRAAAASNAAAR